MRSMLSKVIVLIVIIISSLIVVGINTKSISAQGSSVQGPFIGTAVRPGSFNGDLRQLPKLVPQNKTNTPRRMAAPRKSSQLVPTDSVVQASPAALRMPSPVMNFDGLDMLNAGDAGIPPDSNGDVNATYFVQAAVMGIGVYDKMTGTQLVTTTLVSLWSVANTGTPCDTDHREDPVVLYDTITRRWLLTDMAWIDTSPTPASNFYQCVAVSKTNDPINGGWWFYGFLIDANRQIDYSKLAIWSDGYYMSSNMFTPWNGSSTFLGVYVWAMDRAAMTNGAPTSPIKFFLPCGSPCYASLLPSNLRGNMPPNGTPNFFASIDSPDLFHLWKFHVDWTTPLNSTFSASPTDVTVANFNWNINPFANVVPQMSVSTPNLQLYGDRLMMHLQYRNIGGVESLWANHSVYGNGGVIGIRWYEIRNPNGTPSVYQQGTFQPDNDSRWMGSLAVDHNGNMAVGYSASNANIFPEIRYAGRLVSDPLDTLGQGEQVLYQGTGPETDVNGWGSWGDYSGMIVDPADDCTFWYTSEYFGTTANVWRTRIGSFKYPSCNSTSYLNYPLYLPLIMR